ncbi:hypothetical protein TEGL_20630 [Terrisporobacter glycolicus ATCC 14880 = DSM 1288]|uniref:Uncharacterized protein n=1 Tax=Terrisporobacter glycolicus ATCC 14880 = DSM 1288 TaxID=1121315 RepID=A0ABZ2EUQ5_9FIRM
MSKNTTSSYIVKALKCFDYNAMGGQIMSKTCEEVDK